LPSAPRSIRSGTSPRYSDSLVKPASPLEGRPPWRMPPRSQSIIGVSQSPRASIFSAPAVLSPRPQTSPRKLSNVLDLSSESDDDSDDSLIPFAFVVDSPLARARAESVMTLRRIGVDCAKSCDVRGCACAPR
jgi:hypothetical protein